MNIWNVMLDKSGRPISEIFIADSLHMNAKGYAIWNKSVIPFMK
jgi:lysophospholipase L1-like esterase